MGLRDEGEKERSAICSAVPHTPMKQRGSEYDGSRLDIKLQQVCLEGIAAVAGHRACEKKDRARSRPPPLDGDFATTVMLFVRIDTPPAFPNTAGPRQASKKATISGSIM